MEVVNPFILKNKSKIVTFLDEISSCTEAMNENLLHAQTMVKPSASSSGDKSSNSNNANGIVTTGNPSRDPRRELATIHCICEIHVEEISKLGYSRPTLRKLGLVTEVLSKHKNQYAEKMKLK